PCARSRRVGVPSAPCHRRASHCTISFLSSRRRAFVFFFFQAEDGIRARNVTGVQTCALPISSSPFARFLYQERNVPFSGAGKSRTSVHPFKGPGPFSIYSSFVHGFNAVLAMLVLILYAAVDEAHFAKPFIIIFSIFGALCCSSTIISR